MLYFRKVTPLYKEGGVQTGAQITDSSVVELLEPGNVTRFIAQPVVPPFHASVTRVKPFSCSIAEVLALCYCLVNTLLCQV